MKKSSSRSVILCSFYFILFILTFQKATLSYNNRSSSNLRNDFYAHRIAHAGGAINNRTYTNSINALNSNVKKGFQYFEIDFSFTKDKKLVCIHDWNQNFEQLFGFKTEKKLTFDEFNNLVKNKSEFQICTVYTLSEWMKKNPLATIITDVKGSNVSALKILLKTLPNAKVRVIPQVYKPENFNRIKKLGFKRIIWTLYRYKGTTEDVLGWVEKFPTPFAVSMPISKAKTILPKELKKRDISSYVHTVNTIEEAEKYFENFGITEIYTDFLQPKY